ncbi:hypothetical protein [Patulibacter sp. SYSU D01012]|uniref:hypothetical protein n=1 Tax=Patulibacter sp. SYSU D01012 TaxID=2817381 RepID=UPI001B30CF95|nr:hypothetical protein [Patulibacter sp. SYSU D01012]
MPATPSSRLSAPLTAAAALAGLVLAAAPAAAATPSAAPADAAKVGRGTCTTSATDPQARAASFTVTMRALPPARTYGFRTTLQEKAPGGRWTTLTGAAAPQGLGQMEDARPGAASMRRKITVRGLRPGASYRLRVRFRWAFADTTLAVGRTSRACRVVDPRPNLAVGAAAPWIPGAVGGQVVYRVPVRTSRLAALAGRSVGVTVRQGDVVLAGTSFVPAAADDVALVPGRRCVSGQPVVVTVDPAGEIDERDETDNAVTVPCGPEAG